METAADYRKLAEECRRLARRAEDEQHKAVLEQPPAYTRPSWATHDQYPFVEPNRDMLGSFILERPTHDLLRENLLYIIGP